MPAMVKTRYQDDAGRIHPIRIRQQVADALTTPAPVEAVNDRTHVKISKGNREFGIRPRGIRLARTRGEAPNTFVEYAFIPVLGVGDLGDPGNAVGNGIIYNGENWIISGHVPENAR